MVEGLVSRDVRAARRLIVDEVRDALDELFVYMQAQEVLGQKSLWSQQDYIADLVENFRRRLERSGLERKYVVKMIEIYRAAAAKAAGRTEIEYSFTEADRGFTRFITRQAARLFSTFWGSLGSLVHGIFMKELAANHNWQQIRTELKRSTLRMTARRAETIARTEVARAVLEARLNQYSGAGHIVYVEWDPAPESVCSRKPICQDMAGTRYDPAQAHGILPAHPNCRCDWKPVTQIMLDQEQGKV